MATPMNSRMKPAICCSRWSIWRAMCADPDQALRGTNAKFERRFGYIERALAAQGRALEGASLAEMDALWNEAKTKE